MSDKKRTQLRSFCLLQLRPGTAPLLPSASINFSPQFLKIISAEHKIPYIFILIYFVFVVNNLKELLLAFL